MVLVCTGLNAIPRASLEPSNLVMIYLLGVVVVSLWLGRGPSILAAVSERGGVRLLLRAAALDVSVGCSAGRSSRPNRAVRGVRTARHGL